MEIPRQQFLSKIDTVKEAIDECDFISLDTELSGLHRPGGSKRMDTLDNRYAEYREATSRFIIIQFGMCTFKWDEPSGRYMAKPFNFYIFPTSMTGRIQPDRLFMTQAQAFDFLSKQSFDFNKWVYQGVPYLTRAEEREYIAKAEKRIQADMPNIRIDEREKPFVEAALKKIDAWVANPKDSGDTEGVNIATRNAYQRRLIYQEVRNNYKDLTADGRQGFIRIVKLTGKQIEKRKKDQMARVMKDLEEAIGFRRVIDMISASRKVVVGHNMLLDMCHVINQFIQPLPDTVGEFKQLAHSLFPYMIDTKHLVTTSKILGPLIGSGTALENLRFETNQELFKNPYVEMSIEFPRYLNSMEHEAGYDAYITGLVFLKLHSYLELQANPPPSTPEPESEPEPEPEEEIPEEERKRRGNTGGWDISDDEEGEDPKWLESEDEDEFNQGDEEEVYNYGSTRYALFDQDNNPTPILSEFVNKVTMVRTPFKCFDFVNPEVVDHTYDLFYLQSTQALSESDLLEVFSEHGKCIINMIDKSHAFAAFENLIEKQDTVKTKVLEQLSTRDITHVQIETMEEYSKRLLLNEE
ncbi:CAF1 family ribonuclease-domain-containing protein [Fennellomyces sp. T-0311]|nr:CAF1 family ribonuclease-domain-containing protein [Fennellomyces sp. T-0311]